MLKDTKSDCIRYTATDVQRFKEIGIDLSEIKSKQDLSEELINWIKETDEINPELLDKLGRYLT